MSYPVMPQALRALSVLFMLTLSVACTGRAPSIPATPTSAMPLQPTHAQPQSVPPATQTATPVPAVLPTDPPAQTATPTATAVTDRNAGIVFAAQGDPSQPGVAITVDDFINMDVITYWLISYLDENPDVKLTMFPVGSAVTAVEEQYPGLWRHWLDAGHEIGFHSLSHARLDLMTEEQLSNEIAEFNRLVGEVVGDSAFRVRWARTTYGEYGGSREMFAEVAEAFGLTWVRWSVIPSHRNYVGHLYGMEYPDAVQNGDIALFHVRWLDQYWMERYVGECRRRGVEMLTLSDMQLLEEGQGEDNAIPLP